MTIKMAALLLSLVLLLGVGAGGTLAWLVDETNPVENTFTPSNVEIELEETTGTDYQLIPGFTIAKDPKVTVKAGSEKCYVFVKVTKSNNWPAFTETDEMTLKVRYDIADSWTKLDGETGVYYRIEKAVPKDATNLPSYSVIKDDTIYVSENLTKEEMKQITTAPTLTITAYACQYYKTNDVEFGAADAWRQVKPQS